MNVEILFLSTVLVIGRKVLCARTLTLYSNLRLCSILFLYIQVNLRVERILNFFRLAPWLCGGNFFFCSKLYSWRGTMR